MRFFIRLSALCIFAVSLWLVGCRSAPARLTLFVSGNSVGYLEPCGCRTDQSGGLPGRARVIAGDRSDRVVLDVGNLTAGTKPYDLLKLKYLMQGMKAIGYDAVNLGKHEAELDLPTLQSVVASGGLPFVSANVVAKATGKCVAEPYRIVQRGGAKIGVVGVAGCDPTDVGPGLTVRPAIEALAELVPQLRRKCDYLVVLAFVDDDHIREIADKLHEVDCILGGDVAQPSGAVQMMNRAAVFNMAEKGKIVGKIELQRKGDTYIVASSSAIRIAADKVQPPPAIADLLVHYKSELRNRRFELASAEGMDRIEGSASTADEYVGAQACLKCHEAAHKTWVDSTHSQAFETLKKKGSDFDPECLKCHTVGYGLAGGFADASTTPSLEGVQCENCHGRGKEHTETQSKRTLKPVTPSTCISCHDTENSENFHYATFWPKIKH